MRGIRQFLRDRVLAGGFAALAVYLLVFQALAGGMAQGAMAAAAVDPLNVICTVDGATSPDGHKHGGGDGSECPCGMLCRHLAGGAAALPVDGASALAAPFVAGSYRLSHRSVPLAPSQRVAAFSARAPPHSS